MFVVAMLSPGTKCPVRRTTLSSDFSSLCLARWRNGSRRKTLSVWARESMGNLRLQSAMHDHAGHQLRRAQTWLMSSPSHFLNGYHPLSRLPCSRSDVYADEAVLRRRPVTSSTSNRVDRGPTSRIGRRRLKPASRPKTTRCSAALRDLVFMCCFSLTALLRGLVIHERGWVECIRSSRWSGARTATARVP